MHTQQRPIGYGSLGHYQVTYRAILAAAQAANSRLFEMRNSGTNLLVLTRCSLRVMQTAAGTAQENSIDMYRCTGFTVVDTTNTVTPTASSKRTGMGAAPGNAVLRGVTAAGAAAGMTGGTLTKDGGASATCPFTVNTATAVSTALLWGPYDCVDDSARSHMFVFPQNEGFIVENRVLNVTSYGMTFYLDVCWAEVTAY